VPEENRTDRLLLRPLQTTDVELDYDAVMSSAEQLRRWSQSIWPADDFTLAQNLADLERHEREHNERKAFTYTVLNPQATKCLGCVYIEALWPEAEQLCPEAESAAVVSFWVCTSEWPNDLNRHLLDTLQEWFKNDWAFDCVLFGTSPQDARQPALFADSGLEQRLAFPLPNGGLYLVFR
jgi:RimJ/RimL family protein N-acetyltransferase